MKGAAFVVLGRGGGVGKRRSFFSLPPLFPAAESRIGDFSLNPKRQKPERGGWGEKEERAKTLGEKKVFFASLPPSLFLYTLFSESRLSGLQPNPRKKRGGGLLRRRRRKTVTTEGFFAPFVLPGGRGGGGGRFFFFFPLASRRSPMGGWP